MLFTLLAQLHGVDKFPLSSARDRSTVKISLCSAGTPNFYYILTTSSVPYCILKHLELITLCLNAGVCKFTSPSPFNILYTEFPIVLIHLGYAHYTLKTIVSCACKFTSPSPFKFLYTVFSIVLIHL